MAFPRFIAAVLAVGVAAAAHAERLVTWQVQGHITGVDVAADPTYADLWSKLQPGQTYVASFLVDLDALPDEQGQYRPIKGSTLDFKEAGLDFQLSTVSGGIVPTPTGLDIGWGYGSRLAAPGSPGVAYSFGGFSRSGGTGTGTLVDCDDAIRAQGWSHSQPIHFGFVDGDLMSLGTFVHATVDSLSSSGVASTSAVPEADTVALVLAGLPMCMAFRAAQRHAAVPRSSRPAP